MLNLILLILFILVVIAVLNWRMPRKSAARWSVIPIMIFPILNFFIPMGTFTIFTPGASDQLLAVGEGLTITVMALFILPLSFFATEYIQYRKDKANMEVIKKTLSYALIYLACLSVVAIFSLYFFLNYIYGGS